MYGRRTSDIARVADEGVNTLDNFDTLRVRVITHSERARNGIRKISKHVSQTSIIIYRLVQGYKIFNVKVSH